MAEGEVTKPKPKVKKPINILAIPSLEFIDDAGMHYFLEQVRLGEYVLRPKHDHTG
jgi:hypothetical protein